MPDSRRLPRIAVIGCGGTISSLGVTSLDVMDYSEHGRKLAVQEVLARVPEAALVADALPVPFREVGSTAIGPADWLELRATIRRLAREQPDLAGFVVLHGTATLEETAFFLNLTLDVPQTVVLTGAQRPISAVGSDAPANLISALRVAGAPQSRGRGVLVVMNDEINAARDVVKTSMYRVQTFRATPHGTLGSVEGDGVHFYRRVDRPRAPDTPFTTLADDAVLPRVDIVLSYAGADGALIEAAMAAGARGLVSAGLAPGIPARGQRDALEAAVRAGVVVVQCSRAFSGRVVRRRYLQENGFVAGEDFSPQKARILLALALAQGADLATIRGYFATY